MENTVVVLGFSASAHARDAPGGKAFAAGTALKTSSPAHRCLLPQRIVPRRCALCDLSLGDSRGCRGRRAIPPAIDWLVDYGRTTCAGVEVLMELAGLVVRLRLRQGRRVNCRWVSLREIVHAAAAVPTAHMRITGPGHGAIGSLRTRHCLCSNLAGGGDGGFRMLVPCTNFRNPLDAILAICKREEMPQRCAKGGEIDGALAQDSGSAGSGCAESLVERSSTVCGTESRGR